jgi:hypothetical protein
LRDHGSGDRRADVSTPTAAFLGGHGRRSALLPARRDHEYGPALKTRRSAALDRTDSKADRISTAADRTKLTEDDSTPPGVDNG